MKAAVDIADRPFTLTIERPRQLAQRDEVGLLRAAVASGTASATVRLTLATMLFVHDQFDEAIALLEPLVAEAPTFDAVFILAECHISRETAADDDRAVQVARRALTLAPSDYHRATALAALGKALRRQGKTGAAREVLIEALAVDPGNVNAYKRLVAIDLEAGDAAHIYEMAENLIAEGVGHSRLQVARIMALGMLGRIEEAREAIGLGHFLHQAILSPPPGWETIDAFNDALRAELVNHPDIRYDRYGTASEKTWRIDQPAVPGSVMLPQLQKAIHGEVSTYVAALGLRDTPWTRARPDAAVLHNWCVMADAEGYEEWHVHQNGWLSGVYYVDVPPFVTTGDGRGGCIAFGMPHDHVGEDIAKALGEHLVRPRAGLLMLFPSHTYHRTFAHGGDYRRICVAFDIQPSDPATL